MDLGIAVAGWATSSVGMTLLNKVAVSSTDAPFGVLIVQMSITCVLALASRNIHLGEGTQRWAMTVPWLFFLMMMSSMLALHYVSIGTFVVIRNLGPIVTLGIESTVHPDSQLACDLPTVLSLFSVVLGVIVSEGVDVLTSVPSSPGIALLLLNLACTCGERMVQRHLLAVQTVDVSKPGLMLINNSVGMILVACATPLRPGEVTRTLHALSKWPSPGLHVLLSALVGSAICYFGLKLQ